MAEMDLTKYLECFEKLTENDINAQEEAISYILNVVSDNQNAVFSEENVETPNVTENSRCFTRNYKYKYITQNYCIYTQYCIDRLLKGLKSGRKDSRNGFTKALKSVLHARKDDVDLEAIYLHLIETTSKYDNNETKDVLCGRLHGLFILELFGFFRQSQILDKLPDVYNMIWDIYDTKIYFQSACCWLLYLISKDIYETFNDNVFLTHVKNRLHFILDEQFVDKIGGANNDESVQSIGKGFTGILPCPLLGLYIKINELVSKSDSIMSDKENTWINNSPLKDPEFSLCLRYIVGASKYYPFIGWFFEAFVEIILKSEFAPLLLSQLWNCISLNLLVSTASVQKQLVGLYFTSVLLIHLEHDQKLMALILTKSSNLLNLLNVHSNPRNSSNVAIYSRHVLQLFEDILKPLESNITRSQGSIHSVEYNFPIQTTGYTMYICINDNFINVGKESLICGPLSDADRIVCMMSVAKALDYTCNKFHTRLMKRFVSNYDCVKLYNALECSISNLELNVKVIQWIFAMLQMCIDQCLKTDMLQLMERFVILKTCWIPFENGPFTGNIYINLLTCCNSTSAKSRCLLVTTEPLLDHKVKGAVATQAKGLLSNCIALNNQVLMSAVSLLSRIHQLNNTKSLHEMDKSSDPQLIQDIYKRLFYTICDLYSFNGIVKTYRDQNDGLVALSQIGECEIKLGAIGQFNIDGHLSRQLLVACEQFENSKVKQFNCISSSGYILSLLLLLIECQWHHLQGMSCGFIKSKDEMDPLVPIEIVKFLVDFSNAIMHCLSANNYNEAVQRLDSQVLIDAIFLEHESPVVALLHSVAKRLWPLVTDSLPPRVIKWILAETLITPCAENDESFEEGSDLLGDEDSSDESSEENCSDSLSEESEGTHVGKRDGNANVEIDMKSIDAIEDSENGDIELTPSMAFDELGNDANGNRNLLRLERRRLRGLEDIDPKGLNYKIRHGELLIPVFKSINCFEDHHLECIRELFKSIVKASNLLNRKLGLSTMNVLNIYINKLVKVIATIHQGLKKSRVIRIEANVKVIGDLLRCVLNAQCYKGFSNKILQMVSALVFAVCYKIELAWEDESFKTTGAYLSMGFMAMALGKYCELRMDFIRNLLSQCPNVLAGIDYVKLALLSNVSFKRSQMLEICLAVLRRVNCYPTTQKWKEIKVTDEMIGPFARGIDKRLSCTNFFTMNLLESTLEQLVLLLDQLNSFTSPPRNENEPPSKRKKNTMSKQLIKAIANLSHFILTRLPHAESSQSLHKQLLNTCTSLKDQGCFVKQHNILQVTINKLSKSK
ncbi:DNA polymerase V-Myb-binding protein 1A [Babesia duncani]|uniref:DNA polymerase V-Myb-binding protein 1A n=1 Tax=Babesia duncani TaxID=323732 RepID=A0AAD9UMP1_9APIC|nr:DNA polymerase V-Myb-binding protein 1A [Babesia duncani]